MRWQVRMTILLMAMTPLGISFFSCGRAFNRFQFGFWEGLGFNLSAQVFNAFN